MTTLFWISLLAGFAVFCERIGDALCAMDPHPRWKLAGGDFTRLGECVYIASAVGAGLSIAGIIIVVAFWVSDIAVEVIRPAFGV